MAMLRSFLSSIGSLLQRGEAKAAMTSACIMAMGDATCQSIIAIRSSSSGMMTRAAAAAPSSHESSRDGSHGACDAQDDNRLLSLLDLKRCARFALVGFTLHGPFFLHGFRWIDNFMGPSKGLGMALRKAALGQVTIFPIYLSCFLVYMSLLEGGTMKQAKHRLQQLFLPSFAAGTAFWPAANVVNFMLVPPSGRVAYVAGAGLLWNTYLSWVNSCATTPG